MSYQNGIINYLQKNEITITFTDNEDTGVTPIAAITSDNIVSESLTLKQSICDNDALTFGGCIASELSIKLLNTNERQFTTELTGRWISVQITQFYADPEDVVYPSSALYSSSSTYPGTQVNSQSFYVFSGYIDCATIDKTDKNIINIKAYDFLAKLHEQDATDFLYLIFKSAEGATTPYTLSYLFEQATKKANNGVLNISYSDFNSYFREQYTNRLDITTTVGSFKMHNALWMARKDRISFGTLLKNICEVLAVFCYVNPNGGKGVLTTTRLSGTVETYNFYEKCETEDYPSTGYKDFKFSVYGNDRTGKSVIGGGLSDAYSGAVDKTYDFSENVLIMQEYVTSGQGRTSTDFDLLVNRTSVGVRLAQNATVAGSFHPQFSTYQPLEATLDGRLWVTVGTPIQIMVNETTPDGDYPRDPDTGEYILDEHGQHPKYAVQTYVLSRTLTGIHALTDNITVKGVR